MKEFIAIKYVIIKTDNECWYFFPECILNLWQFATYHQSSKCFILLLTTEKIHLSVRFALLRSNASSELAAVSEGTRFVSAVAIALCCIS